MIKDSMINNVHIKSSNIRARIIFIFYVLNIHFEMWFVQYNVPYFFVNSAQYLYLV